jgi:hypothetical protein
MWLQLKVDTRLEDERIDKLRGAITRLTVGSFIVFVGGAVASARNRNNTEQDRPNAMDLDNLRRTDNRWCR